MSCGPRSRRATPWVYWQEERKRHFNTFVSRWSLIQLELKLLQSCPPARRVYIPNLKEIAPAISGIRAAKVLTFSSLFFFLVHVFAHLQKLLFIIIIFFLLLFFIIALWCKHTKGLLVTCTNSRESTLHYITYLPTYLLIYTHTYRFYK